ncbi:MAG: DUF3488 domain-containing protein, partial [Gammaproteobacteria bacterium]|nr:DUF3488 domain-containing protein [Gammaproteobacteria bacterium]
MPGSLRNRISPNAAAHSTPGQVPPGPAARSATPTLRPLLWTAGVLLAAIALHVDRLPPWCTLAILVLAGWRVVAALQGRAPPGGLVRTAIGLALLLAVAGQFSGVSGLAGGSALLACMGALKLLETRAR